MTCRHNEDTSTIFPETNYRWASESRSTAFGGTPMLFILCPRKFKKAQLDRGDDSLRRWIELDFAGGAVVWSDLLWVLAPDPGCEL